MKNNLITFYNASLQYLKKGIYLFWHEKYLNFTALKLRSYTMLWLFTGNLQFSDLILLHNP